MAALARAALHAASVNPLDDPRWLVCGLADGMLRGVLAPNPIERLSAYAAAPECRLRPGALGRVFVFRTDPDKRVWGNRLRGGTAKLLLMVHGLACDAESCDDLACWLALPMLHPTVAEAATHPFATPEFLASEVARRDAAATGLYLVRKSG